jgi:hypothetical protein
MEKVKEIISDVIGPLKQNELFEDWWESREIEIPFFGNIKLKVVFMDFEPDHDKEFIEEADNSLKNFLGLNVTDRNKISELVYKNCMDFLESVQFDDADEKLRQIKEKNDIWNFVKPTNINVSRRHRRDKDIYIHIDCECDWEEEHGLQLVFRQGKKLIRISEQDGHLTEADAYDKPDTEDELLSQF